jgi:hypothetical protein
MRGRISSVSPAPIPTANCHPSVFPRSGRRKTLQSPAWKQAPDRLPIVEHSNLSAATNERKCFDQSKVAKFKDRRYLEFYAQRMVMDPGKRTRRANKVAEALPRYAQEVVAGRRRVHRSSARPVRVSSKTPAACRTTAPAMNHGSVDLGALKAQRLYSNAINPEGVTRLIKAAAASNAWLIFYTHDVDEPPTMYGCTPGLFEAALETALAEHCDILPVRNALGMIGFRQ